MKSRRDIEVKRNTYNEFQRKREKVFRDYNTSQKTKKMENHGKFYSIGKCSSILLIVPVMIYLVLKFQDFSMIVFCLTVLNLIFFIFMGRPYNLVETDQGLVEEYEKGLVSRYKFDLKNDDFDSVIMDIKKALRLRETTDLYCDGALVYRLMINFKSAEEYCEKALTFVTKEYSNSKIINNYKTFIYLLMAEMKSDKGDIESTENYINSIYELNENINTVFLRYIGEIYINTGELKDKGEEIFKVVEKKEDFPSEWKDLNNIDKKKYLKGVLEDEISKICYETQNKHYKASASGKKQFTKSKIIFSEKHPSKSFIKFSSIFAACASALYLFKYDFLTNIHSLMRSEYSFFFYRDSIIYSSTLLLFSFYMSKYIFFPENTYIIEKEG